MKEKSKFLSFGPQYATVLAVALAAAQVTGQVTHTDVELPVPVTAAETVAGVACEVRSRTPATVQPLLCWTYDAAGVERQAVRFNNNFGIWRLDAGAEWRPFRLEVPLKRGVAKLRLRLQCEATEAAVAAGIEVRNAQFVPGGFPATPPYDGPPYFDWIDALAANPEWEQHPEQPGRPLKDLPEAMKPYKTLPVPALIALMPDHRPFGFADCGLTKPHEQPIALTLKWTPAEPDVLRRPDGTVYDPDKEFTFDKVEEVTAPSGRTLRYAYYDPPRDQWEKMTPDNIKGFWGFDRFVDPPLCRVYRDAFMTEVRSRELLRAADQFARHYLGTGDRDSGVRAAAILYSLARVIRDFPVHGMADGDRGARFLPPDAYDQWFAFIIGNWYTPSTALLNRLLSDFSMVRDPALWQELSARVGEDSRARVVNDVFLYVVKTSLKYDAFQRCQPWTFYHNTIGGQIQTFIKVGRRLGCPDLVHYAVRKAAGAVRFTFMADGMFPQSTSYLGDMAGGLGNALAAGEGYTDPDGFAAPIDGRRYRDLAPTQAIPLYGLAERLKEQLLKFPNGDPVTIHDTWPGGGTGCSDKEINASYLVPDFGHAALGWGAYPAMVEVHLHFSGSYSHSHADMLTFTLWAYGDELASDLGYTHFGAYLNATPCHNLVVVDGREQRNTDRGDLLAFSARPGGAQIAQAQSTEAYAQATRYRRLLVTVPFGPGRDAVVDVFEVNGGSRHEWTANGCADYAQTVETDLPLATDPAEAVSSMAPGGKIMDGQAMLAVRRYADYRRDHPSPFYGAFRVMPRRKQAGPGPGRWQVTMRPTSPVAVGTPGASRRATATGSKPGLRLHYLAPEDATPVLSWAPRHRYANEGSIWADRAGFAEFWGTNLMPKIFVRRDGADLESTFVAVWEPFMNAPHMAAPERLAAVAEKDGVGVRLRSGDDEALVLYRKPENTGPLRAAGVRLDGRCAVLCTSDGKRTLDLVETTGFANGEIAVILPPAPTCRVVTCARRGDISVLTLAGDATPVPVLGVNDGGNWIRFDQKGQASWWLPVATVKTTANAHTEVELTRLAGFEYDGTQERLRETHYPFRMLRGAAAARFPTDARLTWQKTPEGALMVSVRAVSGTRLRLKGVRGEVAAKARPTGRDAWLTVPVTASAEGVDVTLAPGLADQGQLTLVVAESATLDAVVARAATPAGAGAAPKSAVARYVRIELPGQKRSLGLAEVQVFDVAGTNLAANAAAALSTPPYAETSGASKAIDGNTDGNYWNGSVAHGTVDVADPWFELDLRSECDVARVVIWNRTDACPFRLVPATVELLDASRKAVVTWSLDATRTRYVLVVE